MGAMMATGEDEETAAAALPPSGGASTALKLADCIGRVSAALAELGATVEALKGEMIMKWGEETMHGVTRDILRREGTRGSVARLGIGREVTPRGISFSPFPLLFPHWIQ